MSDETNKRRLFLLLVLSVQVLSVALIALMVVWLAYYRGGFNWNPSKGEEHMLFNYHPLFMTLGMGFLFGDAVLVYRIFHNERKTIIKMVHGSMLLAALLVAVAGLVAVFRFHNAKDIPNMYSIHSWLGISTVVAFCLQLLLGCVSFLFPKLSLAFRTCYLPVHVFAGVCMLAFAVGCALTGLTEKALFVKELGYSKKTPEAILINVMGLVFVLFGCLVGYIVSNPNFKRQPSAEEMSLQLTEHSHD